ncbi:MAG: tRNA (N6-isopentenyl adenosine(37)-C2)-methylthiotransferase MiaB, partial [Candidatus Woesearchaeota archaeon]
MKKYKVITYGCQMNVHESEKLAGILEAMDYEPVEDINKSDVIVFNTCTIRENAVNRAFGNIGNLKKLKKDNPSLIIAVGGCMPQKKEDAIRLKETFPFVDIIFGTHNLYKFSDYLKNRIENKEKQFKIWPEDTTVLPKSTEIKRDDKLNAYINITYGCNNFCTYCIVPYVRGRERSRNMQDIVEEFKQ